ncbi:hypothetical protein [Micromonospora sp. NPDC005197]
MQHRRATSLPGAHPTAGRVADWIRHELAHHAALHPVAAPAGPA